MPVFAAFGWAGEENALNYALGELNAFVEQLYQRLPPEIRREYASRGVNEEDQNVYLATVDVVDDEAFIAFNARPMSFEIQLGIANKDALAKGLSSVNKDISAVQSALSSLDSSWTLRVQQMGFDKETGQRVHHSDLYKDSASALTLEQAETLFSRAAYLNSEDAWVTPIYLSLRLPSERIAAMGMTVIDITADLVTTLTPIIGKLLGRKPRKPRKAAKPAAPIVVEPSPTVSVNGEGLTSAASIADSAEGFTYITIPKPLHIRRGFINLTSGHWPFFALNSRTETRDVTVDFDGRQDTNSSVWRLKPDDQARLILGKQAHQWLEENYTGTDPIRVDAGKTDQGEISIILSPVE